MQDLDSFLGRVYGAYAQTALDSSSASSFTPGFASVSTNTPTPADQPAPAKTSSSARSRCGRKPFGHYNGELAIIQKMLELRGRGMGFDRMADQLNEEGVPSRSGKAWHGRVVNRIIKAAQKRH